MERDILTSSFMDLRDKLHHIALRYLQNDEDAKDVLQESWLKLKLKNNVSDPNEARNKLVRVLRNVCIDRLRRTNMKTIDEVKTPVSLQYEMEVEDIKYVGKSVERRTDTSTTTDIQPCDTRRF